MGQKVVLLGAESVGRRRPTTFYTSSYTLRNIFSSCYCQVFRHQVVAAMVVIVGRLSGIGNGGNTNFSVAESIIS